MPSEYQWQYELTHLQRRIYVHLFTAHPSGVTPEQLADELQTDITIIWQAMDTMRYYIYRKNKRWWGIWTNGNDRDRWWKRYNEIIGGV